MLPTVAIPKSSRIRFRLRRLSANRWTAAFVMRPLMPCTCAILTGFASQPPHDSLSSLMTGAVYGGACSCLLLPLPTNLWGRCPKIYFLTKSRSNPGKYIFHHHSAMAPRDSAFSREISFYRFQQKEQSIRTLLILSNNFE